MVSWLRKGACTEKVARTDPGFNVVVVVVEGGGWVAEDRRNSPLSITEIPQVSSGAASRGECSQRLAITPSPSSSTTAVG